MQKLNPESPGVDSAPWVTRLGQLHGATRTHHGI